MASIRVYYYLAVNVLKTLKKLAKAAELGVDKRNLEPHSPTILTKCAPFSSGALNFRYRICDEIGGTVMLISSE